MQNLSQQNFAMRISQPSTPEVSRHFVALFALAIWPAVVGCSPPPAPKSALPTTEVASTSRQTPSLRDKIDTALEFTLQRRILNTSEHGAWQILHGALAFQLQFPTLIGQNGDARSAVEYALQGGTIRGWTLEPGDMLPNGRRGLKAIVEPGTKKGQGHADQWLAILAQCGLKQDQPIQLGDQTFRLSDLVEQVKYDAPFNAAREWSWTLIGLSYYLPWDAEWTARDEENWSIERMVREELGQQLNESACGGTHRLIGIATALNHYVDSGQPLEGTWQGAHNVVRESVGLILQDQNPDGSFSAQYLRRPSHSSDMATTLGTTGHMLEFLTVAMQDDELSHRQVEFAVNHLCELFHATETLSLECGALYHAAHGLRLYRERRFGPSEFTP